MQIKLFENLKHLDKDQKEFWYAHELANILGYVDFLPFAAVIEKAQTSCKLSGYNADEHFKKPDDTTNELHLSRYACYLVMQNADSSHEIVAQAQSYFAIQTRKQEVKDQLEQDQMRVLLRNELKEHNKTLAGIAKQVGVVNFSDFTDAGYQGLYGGLKQSQIHEEKGLKKEEKILDHMDSQELAANLFRATQTEARIKREKIIGQEQADLSHFEIGKKVRATIKEIGGIMPEYLPAVEDINSVEKRLHTIKV